MDKYLYLFFFKRSKINNMRFIWFILLFILTNIIVKAGTNFKIDSMEKSLEGEMSDTLRLQTHNDIAWEYFNFDMAIARDYADQSLALALKTGYRRGEGAAYETIAVIFYYKGDFQQAMTFYKKDRKIKQESMDNNTDTSKTVVLKHRLSTSFNNMGVLYMQQGNNDKALELLFKSLNLRLIQNTLLQIRIITSESYMKTLRIRTKPWNTIASP